MGAAYDAGAWQTFYATVAGAAAALVGLLFVVLSLHLRAIMTNPGAHGRAREVFGGFLGLLVLALLVLIPGQGRSPLGVELLTFGVVRVGATVRFQGETLRRLSGTMRRRRLRRLVPLDLGTVAIFIAAISLLLGRFGGLFWLMPTVVIYLVNSLVNAWVLMVLTGEG